jgi:HemY protein
MAQGLLSVSQYDIARGLVEESLDAQWDEALIDIYPKCVIPGTSNLSLAQKLESWMIKYPGEPALSLALARICLDQQLWGKAKASLVGVIRDPKTKPPMKAAAHMAMAQLHESLNESAEAAGEYELAAKIYSKIVIDR